jgi:hypothetical protein
MVQDGDSNEKIEINAGKISPKHLPKLKNVIVCEFTLIPDKKPSETEVPKNSILKKIKFLMNL